MENGREPSRCPFHILLCGLATVEPGRAQRFQIEFMRSLVPTFCLCAAVALFPCFSARGQDAAVELFRRMQHALGGAEKIASIQDFEEIVKASTWNRSGQPIGEVRKRVRWVKPNHLRLDQVGPGDTYALYFNGTSGWEILPNGRPADLTGGELDFAKKYLSDFKLNVWLADRLPGYRISSPAANVIRVSVNNKASEQIDITLDPDSLLPVKETSVSLADPAHPVPSETQIRKWGIVQGMRFPDRVWVLHSGVRLADITTEEVKLNSGLKPEDLATKPADLKPDLPSR